MSTFTFLDPFAVYSNADVQLSFKTAVNDLSSIEISHGDVDQSHTNAKIDPLTVQPQTIAKIDPLSVQSQTIAKIDPLKVQSQANETIDTLTGQSQMYEAIDTFIDQSQTNEIIDTFSINVNDTSILTLVQKTNAENELRDERDRWIEEKCSDDLITQDGSGRRFEDAAEKRETIKEGINETTKATSQDQREIRRVPTYENVGSAYENVCSVEVEETDSESTHSIVYPEDKEIFELMNFAHVDTEIRIPTNPSRIVDDSDELDSSFDSDSEEDVGQMNPAYEYEDGLVQGPVHHPLPPPPLPQRHKKSESTPPPPQRQKLSKLPPSSPQQRNIVVQQPIIISQPRQSNQSQLNDTQLSTANQSDIRTISRSNVNLAHSPSDLWDNNPSDSMCDNIIYHRCCKHLRAGREAMRTCCGDCLRDYCGVCVTVCVRGCNLQCFRRIVQACCEH